MATFFSTLTQWSTAKKNDSLCAKISTKSNRDRTRSRDNATHKTDCAICGKSSHLECIAKGHFFLQ